MLAQSTESCTVAPHASEVRGTTKRDTEREKRNATIAYFFWNPQAAPRACANERGSSLTGTRTHAIPTHALHKRARATHTRTHTHTNQMSGDRQSVNNERGEKRPSVSAPSKFWRLKNAGRIESIFARTEAWKRWPLLCGVSPISENCDRILHPTYFCVLRNISCAAKARAFSFCVLIWRGFGLLSCRGAGTTVAKPAELVAGRVGGSVVGRVFATAHHTASACRGWLT